MRIATLSGVSPLSRPGEALRDCISLVAYLLIPLAFAWEQTVEANTFDLKKAWLGRLVLAGLMLLYYFNIPDTFRSPELIRFSTLLVGAHLLASVFPFFKNFKLRNAFWQYNRLLFVNIVHATFLGTISALGISLLILLVDQLFPQVDISYRAYSSTAVVVFTWMTTFRFLSIAPKNILRLEGDLSESKFIQFLSKYILVPLVSLYFLVLLIYGAKILAAWDLPKGSVAAYIIGASLVGILALLLVEPQRSDRATNWITYFSKFFFYAFFPLIVLMTAAIYRRLRDYGFTEDRYIVVIWAGWLFFVAIYFLWSRTKNLMIVPGSLLVIAFTITWGPWGFESVSFRSQTERLQDLIENLQPGAAVNSDAGSVYGYLLSTHDRKRLENWSQNNFHSSIDDLRMKYGLTTQYSEIKWTRVEADRTQVVSLPDKYFYYELTKLEKRGANPSLSWELDEKTYNLKLSLEGYPTETVDLSKWILDLRSLESVKIPVSLRTFDFETPSYQGTLIVNSVGFKTEGNETSLANYGFSLIYKIRIEKQFLKPFTTTGHICKSKPNNHFLCQKIGSASLKYY